MFWKKKSERQKDKQVDDENRVFWKVLAGSQLG